jgi:predicted DNA-binding transcriptional regulator AlpA
MRAPKPLSRFVSARPRCLALTRLRAAPAALRSPDTSYDDLLLSTRPFPQPVPLGVRPSRSAVRKRIIRIPPVVEQTTTNRSRSRAHACFARTQEVVDFLVECWDEDGLYA